jgi:protein kinase-like protein
VTLECRSCSGAVAAGARFCPSCGAAVGASGPPSPISALETRESPLPRSQDRTPSDVFHGRFLPGTILGQRYRIVELLGQGGMGEVYRADDIKLGQAVALKLLPARFAGDEARLARLLDEVRLTRLISHPNVCRVYDIGEAEGEHFLSMEYALRPGGVAHARLHALRRGGRCGRLLRLLARAGGTAALQGQLAGGVSWR